MKPAIIINLKTYESGTGINAEKIARICGNLSSRIIVAAQATDISRAAKYCETYAQHIDSFLPGRNTGFITAEAARAAGAKGTLINHAEHKLPMGEIKAAIERARQNRLSVIACAASTSEAQELAKSGPDSIAIEPPELISGNTSVSEARPEIITGTIEAVRKIRDIPVICGAGIHRGEDVRAALKLGARGVLVANFVMSAKDKEKAIKELLGGLK